MVINRIYIMQGDFMLLMCKNTPVYELDPDDFDEQTIMELFGKAGAQMLIIDAVIGNGDRHAGNFGWLRNMDTGEYVSMAPLYDFDHALDSTLESDRLLTDAVKFCMPYKDEEM